VRYIVSACLAGVACRYDGKHSRDEDVVRLVESGSALPACPEQLGGLATPRPPAEFRGGDGRAVLRGDAAVADQAGRTVTDLFLRGAVEFYRLARTFGAKGAVLKDRSPSCGLKRVTIDGRVGGGRGVAAALLEGEGLKLISPAGLRRDRPGGPPRR
jgi:uncharacterized protein YbbK (DUF523 family)